jgi:hypothetical protein
VYSECISLFSSQHPFDAFAQAGMFKFLPQFIKHPRPVSALPLTNKDARLP